MKKTVLYIFVLSMFFASCSTTQKIPPNKDISQNEVNQQEQNKKKEKDDRLLEFHLGAIGGALITILATWMFK